MILAWILRHWRDVALAAALAVVAMTGRCAAERAREAAEWKAEYLTARSGADAAIRELADARRATDKASSSLDSAVSWWASYAAELERALRAPHAPPADTGGVEAPVPPPATDTRLAELLRRGNELLQACTEYRSKCEEERARSSAAIDSLKGVIHVLEQRPTERAPLFSPRVGGGYDPLTVAATVGVGVDVRLWGSWQLSAEALVPVARGERPRGFVGLWRSF